MEQCAPCGATLSADAEWCGQCYAPRGGPAIQPFGQLVAAPAGASQAFGRPVSASAPLLPPLRRTRWRKTPTTFGPVGRVVATVLLVVPVVFLVVVGLYGDIFALGGAGLWGFIILPWGLRDVWQAGQLPAR